MQLQKSRSISGEQADANQQKPYFGRSWGERASGAEAIDPRKKTEEEPVAMGCVFLKLCAAACCFVCSSVYEISGLGGWSLSNIIVSKMIILVPQAAEGSGSIWKPSKRYNIWQCSSDQEIDPHSLRRGQLDQRLHAPVAPSMANAS